MKTRWLYAGIGYLITLVGSYMFIQFLHNTISPIPSSANNLILILIISPIPNISHFFSIGIGYYMGLRKEFNLKLRKRSIGAIIGYIISVLIWLFAGSQFSNPALMLSFFIIGIIPINLPHSILLLSGHFIGKNFETPKEIEHHQIAKNKMVHRKKSPKNKEKNKNNKIFETKNDNITFTEVNLSKTVLKQRINELKQINERVFVSDIENILENDSMESKKEADRIITQREKSLNHYQSIFGDIHDIRSKIMKLTDRIAEGELDSETYKRALNDLETQLRESEEALWDLRSELFREEYEKPF